MSLRRELRVRSRELDSLVVGVEVVLIDQVRDRRLESHRTDAEQLNEHCFVFTDRTEDDFAGWLEEEQDCGGVLRPHFTGDERRVDHCEVKGQVQTLGDRGGRVEVVEYEVGVGRELAIVLRRRSHRVPCCLL